MLSSPSSREPATLQNADAVLSGQSSAEFESTPEDLVRGGPHGFGTEPSAVRSKTKVGWTLPSPACATVMILTMYSAAARSILEHVGQFRPRDPDVFHETLPESFGSRIGESTNLE